MDYEMTVERAECYVKLINNKISAEEALPKFKDVNGKPVRNARLAAGLFYTLFGSAPEYVDVTNLNRLRASLFFSALSVQELYNLLAQTTGAQINITSKPDLLAELITNIKLNPNPAVLESKYCEQEINAMWDYIREASLKPPVTARDVARAVFFDNLPTSELIRISQQVGIYYIKKPKITRTTAITLPNPPRLEYYPKIIEKAFRKE